jgi:hypothetical protein
MSKGIMDTALESIHAKIAELETRIADLRIAEREILALGKVSAPQARTESEPKQRQKPGPKPTDQPKRRGRPKASEPAEGRQTIGAAIAEVLDQHGALSAAEISERIKATGRDIDNRSVSFALQALKKAWARQKHGWQMGGSEDARQAFRSSIERTPGKRVGM